nr:MAG TPA: hypothetical protein [Caudoviricetes sp.]
MNLRALRFEGRPPYRRLNHGGLTALVSIATYAQSCNVT